MRAPKSCIVHAVLLQKPTPPKSCNDNRDFWQVQNRTVLSQCSVIVLHAKVQNVSPPCWEKRKRKVKDPSLSLLPTWGFSLFFVFKEKEENFGRNQGSQPLRMKFGNFIWISWLLLKWSKMWTVVSQGTGSVWTSVWPVKPIQTNFDNYRHNKGSSMFWSSWIASKSGVLNKNKIMLIGAPCILRIHILIEHHSFSHIP